MVMVIMTTVNESVMEVTILVMAILEQDMEMSQTLITSAINHTSALFVAKDCVFELFQNWSLID